MFGRNWGGRKIPEQENGELNKTREQLQEELHALQLRAEPLLKQLKSIVSDITEAQKHFEEKQDTLSERDRIRISRAINSLYDRQSACLHTLNQMKQDVQEIFIAHDALNTSSIFGESETIDA